MKYRTRTFYTDKQKSEMWGRWQRGERPRKTLHYQTPAEKFEACVATISWNHRTNPPFAAERHRKASWITAMRRGCVKTPWS